MASCEPLGDARYLLSPGDLYALQQVPEIVEIGVSALKIEGRYKDADYVALTTRAYRKAVDDAWAGLAHEIGPRRGIAAGTGLFAGLGAVFPTGRIIRRWWGRAPRHRGVLMGRVARIGEAGVVDRAVSDAIESRR